MQTDCFVESFVFSDGATFQLLGKVNRHNVRIWGAANPNAIEKHVRDSPKINVFSSMSCRKNYGPFLSMVMPQVQDDCNEFIVQLDGTPPNFNNAVCTFLNENLPNRLIGRFSVEDLLLHHWPSRSPDLSPLVFSLRLF